MKTLAESLPAQLRADLAGIRSAARTLVEKRFRDFIRTHFAHTLRAGNLRDAAGCGETWQQDILASFGRKDPRVGEGGMIVLINLIYNHIRDRIPLSDSPE